VKSYLFANPIIRDVTAASPKFSLRYSMVEYRVLYDFDAGEDDSELTVSANDVVVIVGEYLLELISF
jgi:hypothetical protein